MNIKKIIHSLKDIDKKILKIMQNGVKFSIIFCLISIFILNLYCENTNPNTYNIGISLFQSGLFFLSAFIMCGYGFNKIIKELM